MGSPCGGGARATDESRAGGAWFRRDDRQSHAVPGARALCLHVHILGSGETAGFLRELHEARGDARAEAEHGSATLGNAALHGGVQGVEAEHRASVVHYSVSRAVWRRVLHLLPQGGIVPPDAVPADGDSDHARLLQPGPRFPGPRGGDDPLPEEPRAPRLALHGARAAKDRTDEAQDVLKSYELTETPCEREKC